MQQRYSCQPSFVFSLDCVCIAVGAGRTANWQKRPPPPRRPWACVPRWPGTAARARRPRRCSFGGGSRLLGADGAALHRRLVGGRLAAGRASVRRRHGSHVMSCVVAGRARPPARAPRCRPRPRVRCCAPAVRHGPSGHRVYPTCLGARSVQRALAGPHTRTRLLSEAKFVTIAELLVSPSSFALLRFM